MSSPDEASCAKAFGPGHSAYTLVPLRLAEGESQDAVLAQYLKGHSIFINNSAGSTVRNWCPLGLYMVMFPFQDAGAFLSSYHHFLCNSEFTAFHTRHRWGRDLNISVLYPCAEFPSEVSRPPTERTQEIVTVGRFNVHGHNKNQALLVETFKRTLPLMPPGWQLTVMGRVNAGAETQDYVARMVEGCRGLPVRFEFDASELVKQQVLARAALYWSGTGIGCAEPAEASRMEHFGISIVEAMAAGAIPLAYASGGPPEIIEQGVSGFLYRDVEQLTTYSALLTVKHALRLQMHEASLRRSAAFSRTRFDADVARFFESVVVA